jgi:hypothetical protein
LQAAIFILQQLSACPVAHWQPDFNQAHAAHPDRFKLRVITKDGDIVLDPFGGVYHEGAFGYGDFYAVYRQCNEITHADVLQRCWWPSG